MGFFFLKKNRVIQEWWRNKMKMSYFSCYTTQTNWCHIFMIVLFFLQMYKNRFQQLI